MESQRIIGFEIKSLTKKGFNAIKKNSKVPFLIKKIYNISTKEENNQIFFSLSIKECNYKTKEGEFKKLILKQGNSLLVSIKKEMDKFKCELNLDYELVVLYDRR